MLHACRASQTQTELSPAAITRITSSCLRLTLIELTCTVQSYKAVLAHDMQLPETFCVCRYQFNTHKRDRPGIKSWSMHLHTPL